jgi:hypothetical protein
LFHINKPDEGFKVVLEFVAMVCSAILVLDNHGNLLPRIVSQPVEKVQVYKTDGKIEVVYRECLLPKSVSVSLAPQERRPMLINSFLFDNLPVINQGELSRAAKSLACSFKPVHDVALRIRR